MTVNTIKANKNQAKTNRKKNTKSRIQLKNEQKIINAALKLFSRHGFRGATLDQIAHEASLSKPNLLYYFPSKKALYAVALDHVLTIWLAPLKDLDADGDPKTQLATYIDKKMELSRDYPDASRLFAMEVIEGAKILGPILETKLTRLTKNKKNILAKWSKEGKIKKVDGTHLIFMLWAVTQHYADFEAQIESQTGKTLQNSQFFKTAKNSIKSIIFDGIIP